MKSAGRRNTLQEKRDEYRGKCCERSRSKRASDSVERPAEQGLRRKSESPRATVQEPSEAGARPTSRTEPSRPALGHPELFPPRGLPACDCIAQRVESPTSTQLARSPARPGSRKFAMFPMPRTVRQAPRLDRHDAGKINCQRQARNGRLQKTLRSEPADTAHSA